MWADDTNNKRGHALFPFSSSILITIIYHNVYFFLDKYIKYVILRA